MEMTIDQMVDFLTDSFQQIDKETLFIILQSNQYNLERTLDILLSMENENNSTHSSSASASANVSDTTSASASSRSAGVPNFSSPSSSSQNQKHKNNLVKRGARVVLPDDFLRIPGYNEKRQEYVETGSLVNLLADPLFLEELEREFGPNYQMVLREHLQAEALRNTADRASYSDYPPRPQQNVIDSNAPRQFHVTNQRPQSLAPFSHEYYTQTPPPYSHANVTVGQQQPPILSHQSSSSQSQSRSQSHSPPASASSSSSTSWFSSPFSSQSNNPSDQSREPLVGFGGGNPPPPPRDEGPSISERFQNILKSFTSPFASDETPEESKKGLLSEEDDGEEGTWEGGNSHGIEMEETIRSNRRNDNDSADL